MWLSSLSEFQVTRCPAWPLTRPVSLATARRFCNLFTRCSWRWIAVHHALSSMQSESVPNFSLQCCCQCVVGMQREVTELTCVNPLDDDVAEVCGIICRPSGRHLCAIGEVTSHAFVQMRFFKFWEVYDCHRSSSGCDRCGM